MLVAHNGTEAPMIDGKAFAWALRVYSSTTGAVSSRPYPKGDLRHGVVCVRSLASVIFVFYVTIIKYYCCVKITRDGAFYMLNRD